MADFDEINRRFREALQNIGVRDTERAITRVMIQVGSNTAPMVPMATSALINSMHYSVQPAGNNGWRGNLGFGPKTPEAQYFEKRGSGDPETVDYAKYVHDAPGTLLGTNTPRWPRRLGVVWGPNGEPQFLAKGVENTIPDLPAILREEYSQ